MRKKKVFPEPMFISDLGKPRKKEKNIGTVLLDMVISIIKRKK